MNLNLEKLNKLCKDLDDRYDVNSGGCCYVAYLLSQHLEKLGINYKVVGYSDDRVPHKCTVRNIKGRKKDQFPVGNRTCSHYAILVNGVVINNGDYTFRSFKAKLNTSDLEFILDNGWWNEAYNTKYNYRVSKRISSFFKPYEEEKTKENHSG